MLPQSDEDLLTRGEFILWKGTYCYAGVDGSGFLYSYCQPPLDLGFPKDEP
jgi:hypothetical protein